MLAADLCCVQVQPTTTTPKNVATLANENTAKQASMAWEGFEPFLCIHPTVIQRGYDQVDNDVAFHNLPARLILDRARLVGNDGPSHHG